MTQTRRTLKQLERLASLPAVISPPRWNVPSWRSSTRPRATRTRQKTAPLRVRRPRTHDERDAGFIIKKVRLTYGEIPQPCVPYFPKRCVPLIAFERNLFEMHLDCNMKRVRPGLGSSLSLLHLN